MSSGKVVHVLGNQPYDRYIGRKNARHYLEESVLWANPFRIGRDGDRQEVLEKYERRIEELVAACEPGHAFLRSLAELDGLTLACWCAPKGGHLTAEGPTVCHGQILLRVASRVAGETAA